MNFATILLVLVCVALNTLAQILLKLGVRTVGAIDLTAGRLWHAFWALIFEWHIFAGLVCYVVSVAVWMLVLSRIQVSIAYPMASLGYVATAVAAWYLLGEPLTPTRIAGIAVIIAGVVLVARS